MFVYWGIFLILATGAILNQDTGVIRRRFLFVAFAGVPTALMIGLRWKIGPDWGSYADIYHYIALNSLWNAISHEDPGFYALNWFFQQFRAPFWYINLACGVIFTAGLTSFCARQPNPWLAFLVAFPYLVIVVGMSGIRQSAAIGFLFFGLNQYERGHLVRAVLLMLLGAMFHASAMLMAPLCALSYSRNRLQLVAVFAVLLFVMWLLFVKSFGVYAVRYSSEKIQSTGIWYRLAMNALPSIIYLNSMRRFVLDEHSRLLWRNLSIASLALVPLALILPSNTAVDRFVLYLFPLQSFVLGRVQSAFGERRQTSGQLMLLVIAYAAVVQIVFLQFGTYSSFYVPYRSIFQSGL